MGKHLRTDQIDIIGLTQGNLLEERLEDYVVSGLIDFPDVAYDEHADLLYDLAGQVVRHLRTWLSEKESGQVLALHQREIARAVHAQMQDHFWLDDSVEYHHEIRQGFTELKESAFTALNEPPLDYRVSPADKSNMARYLFGGFSNQVPIGFGAKACGNPGAGGAEMAAPGQRPVPNVLPQRQ